MAQEKRLTEEVVTEAYNKCSEKPFIPAACLAEVTDSNSRYMTQELVKLAKEGKFEIKVIGNMYLFRPVFG